MSDRDSGQREVGEKQWFGLAERGLCSFDEFVTLVRAVVESENIRSRELDDEYPVDDLAASKARGELELRGELFSRKEAANYTRRSVAQFDKTIRPHLHNTGCERRPLYFKSEIDECLVNLARPGRPGAVPKHQTTRPALPIGANVSRNQRAQATLLKLRKLPRCSTKKS